MALLAASLPVWYQAGSLCTAPEAGPTLYSGARSTFPSFLKQTVTFTVPVPGRHCHITSDRQSPALLCARLRHHETRGIKGAADLPQQPHLLMHVCYIFLLRLQPLFPTAHSKADSPSHAKSIGITSSSPASVLHTSHRLRSHAGQAFIRCQ